MTKPPEHSPWAPGPDGYYGDFGGSFTPEILHETLAELRTAFDSAWRDPEFWNSYVELMAMYAGRPTPVTYCENLTQRFGGARIYVKREDLNHTGAHKANNVMGQGMLVQRMGKKRVIAETGAGQHGVATATMAARLGLECTIYMGEVDIARQHPNVFWMKQLGAEVVAVTEGTRTLKDAVNACLRDWADSMDDTHYVLGTACGPHPFPQMVTYFQSIIGHEARRQMLDAVGRLPDRVYACVGGGSNASESSRDSSTTPRSNSSAWKRAARESRRACMPRVSPAARAGRASRRATRRSSSRTRRASCRTPIRWPRASTTSASGRCWPTCTRRAAPASSR